MLDVFPLGKQPTKMAAITSMQTISSYIVPFLNLRCGRKQLPSIKLKKDRDTDFHPWWYESPNHATSWVFRSQSSVDHRTSWGVLWCSMSPQHHSRNLVFHWRIIVNQIIFRPRDKYPSIRILQTRLLWFPFLSVWMRNHDTNDKLFGLQWPYYSNFICASLVPSDVLYWF